MLGNSSARLNCNACFHCCLRFIMLLLGQAELEELRCKYKVLSFSAPDEEWLDFVFANRNGSYKGEHYDIIFGPVANDTIYRTFVAYEEGILTKEETIARLKVKKLFDQMTFTTEAALRELKYIGHFTEGRDQHV